jgi:hypothetical protein
LGSQTEHVSVRITMQKLEPGAVLRATREETRDHTGAKGRRDALAGGVIKPKRRQALERRSS